MKYMLLFWATVFSTSMVFGQSAQVVFDVGEQDTGLLSVLELSCRTDDSVNNYAFNGAQSVTATVQPETSCWLTHSNASFIRARYSYHFGLSGTEGGFIPVSYSERDGKTRIIGQETQWDFGTEACIEDADPLNEGNGIITLKPVMVQQLRSDANIKIPALLPGAGYVLVRCGRGQTITYIDGIPVRGQHPIRSNSSSNILLDTSWLGVPAEFENDNSQRWIW